VKNALGAPQSLAVLGGTSEIGLAVCRELAGEGRLSRVVLAGRPSTRLDDAVAEVEAWLGEGRVRSVEFDASDIAAHTDVVSALFDSGDLDVVVLAFGVLGQPDGMLDDPEAAVRVAEVNYVGGVSMGLRVAGALRRQGHGTLVVLSSVAAERGRASNFVYGSSKAGLDTFAQGLGDRLAGSGVRVMVVRPGFVRTKMTAGLPVPPLACDADDVARAVADALRSGRSTVWVPAAMRTVMSGLRHLPRPVFRRLPV
jgi:decaprenylphospho-beta-D-erythro-pentofuranosid-2-ulose 2-reductase